jgi:hypothetical protein
MRSPLVRLVGAAGTLAIFAALGGAAPALAATDYSGTLSTAKPSFAWDGAAGFGVDTAGVIADRVGCTPISACQTTLLNVTEAAGDVTVHIVGQGQNTNDVDLYVYTSDKDGTQGDLLGSSEGASADETVATGELDPGFYLVLVRYATAVAGTYKGTADFTPPEAEGDR